MRLPHAGEQAEQRALVDRVEEGVAVAHDRQRVEPRGERVDLVAPRLAHLALAQHLLHLAVEAALLKPLVARREFGAARLAVILAAEAVHAVWSSFRRIASKLSGGGFRAGLHTPVAYLSLERCRAVLLRRRPSGSDGDDLGGGGGSGRLVERHGAVCERARAPGMVLDGRFAFCCSRRRFASRGGQCGTRAAALVSLGVTSLRRIDGAATRDS